MQLIDFIRTIIRAAMQRIARGLHRITGGRLRPDAITISGFAMHIPIAILIGLHRYNLLAAVLLLVFGLFDALDGELARLQKQDSARGMLLDASTDRLKELLLYSGVAYALATSAHPQTATFAAAACGASISVSYIKAKGEAAMASVHSMSHDALNRLFKDGLLPFELRMFLLIVGLVINQLAVVTAVIAVLASYTALQRLVRITRAIA